MIVLATLALLTLSAGQGSVSAQSHADTWPAGIAPAIAAALSPGGVRATARDTTLDFWWVKSLPVKGASAPSWADVEEGSLVGLVRIAADFRDIRGRIVKTGVYTLRYGIQPANGDHLGVSPFREFLLLSPVAVDTDPAPKGHEGTVALSVKAAGGSHPTAWSIDPPVATAAPLSNHTTELGHQAVVMEVAVSRAGKSDGTLRFGIVLVGRIDA